MSGRHGGQRRARRSAAFVWTMLLLPPVLLAVLIFGYAAATGVSPADPGAEEAIRAALPAILAANHLTLFALLLYLLGRDGLALADLGWSVRTVGSTVAREAGVGVVCALGLYLFKELAIDPVRQLLVGQTPTFTSLFRFRPATLPAGMTLAATGLVFIEESIYRGYAIPFFEKKWGTARAVIVTSALFGLLHWGNGLGAILSTPFLGALLAGVFVWRRNLVAGTVAHALYNLSVLMT